MLWLQAVAGKKIEVETVCLLQGHHTCRPVTRPWLRAACVQPTTCRAVCPHPPAPGRLSGQDRPCGVPSRCATARVFWLLGAAAHQLHRQV